MIPLHLPVLADPGLNEFKNILKQDHILLLAGDFGDLHDFPGTVGKPRLLDDDIDRRSDLFPDRIGRKLKSRHHHHILHTGKGITGIVGMAGRQRSVMARVHGLQHIQRFGSAAFPHDDPVGTHTQSIDHQIPNGDPPLPFDVRRPGFQGNQILMGKFKFGGILHSDD